MYYGREAIVPYRFSPATAGMGADLIRLIDALPELVWTSMVDGTCGFVNRRWCDYSGLTANEGRASGWMSIIHPDELPHIRTIWAAAVAARIPAEFEACLRRYDGVYRRFSIKAAPYYDGAGRLSGWCGINSDIEHQRHAEAQLAAEKRLLELVAQGEPLSDILHELCYEVESLGPGSMCSILFSDAGGQRFRVGAGPNLPPPYNAVLDGLRVDPTFGPCSLAIATKSTIVVTDPPNDPRWSTSAWPGMMSEFGLASCWSAPILGSRGEVLGIFAIYRRQPMGPTSDELELIDRFAKLAGIAMERAQSDAQLTASSTELLRTNHFLAGAQRLSKTGSFSLEPLSDTQVWSEENFRIWEFDPTIRPTMDMVLAAIHPEDRAYAFAVFSAAVEAKRDCEVFYRIVTPHAGVKHLHTVMEVIPDIADRIVYLGSTRDITENRLAEAALRASEADLNHARMELVHVSRVTALSTLTASIAHEVNQPLTGIVTNANTCLRMLDADPPNLEGARATAQRTIRDGNRASEVIQKLRALFTRKPPCLESVDLNGAALEVLALCSSELQRRRVIVRTALSNDVPSILADRVQLQQVILNLVLNAADAMADVQDRLRELRVSSSIEPDGSTLFSVKDVGIGIDPANVDKLFQAFHTTKTNGMGIGLSISRSIIEAHGGQLSGQPNEAGSGATFSFSIRGERRALRGLQDRSAEDGTKAPRASLGGHPFVRAGELTAGRLA
ncbi:PAS domain S-box-containing protein [Ancylobacter sp. 3268]|uniref:ATP-binding protein n=1 Tax=Ancylobacter sp. 3268 TaxID=2817752 RepID=UPI0028615B32|nr:ATP-binding protein [Ancylobacter sp. 3268]MDR6955099.1 PAS domain S-box-containing protein [Ancylobacter sp. 3268]